MATKLKNIVGVTQEQYDTLLTDGSLTVGENTITYSPDDTLYITQTDTINDIDNLQTSVADIQSSIEDLSQEYKLVNSITLTEETSYIHFDTTDDGDAWDFDSVALAITIPICEAGRRVVVSGKDTSYALNLGMSTSTSAITHIISEIKKFGGSGRYITESSYATGTSWVSFSGTTYKNFREVFSDSASYFGDRITMLNIYQEGVSSYPLPVDTIVTVYGKK